MPPKADLGDLRGLAAGLDGRHASMINGGDFDGAKAYKDSKVLLQFLADHVASPLTNVRIVSLHAKALNAEANLWPWVTQPLSARAEIAPQTGEAAIGQTHKTAPRLCAC